MSAPEWGECLCREIDPVDRPCVVCAERFSYVFDHAAREVEELRAQLKATEDKLHRASSAMVAMDAVMSNEEVDRSVLNTAIRAAMADLMPVIVNASIGPVHLIPCPVFRDKYTVAIFSGIGTTFSGDQRRPIRLPRTNTAGLMHVLDRAADHAAMRGTGGTACLLHPEFLAQVVQDFAKMKVHNARNEPFESLAVFTQETPRNKQ